MAIQIRKKDTKNYTSYIDVLEAKVSAKEFLQHLDQNKQSNSICGGGNMPRINDKIRYRLPGKDWIVAVIKGTGGKATGKNKNYFNICNMDNGEELGIHLDKTEFHVVNDDLSVQNDRIDNGNSNNEEVHTVYVPVE